jgi:hypothetical protein
MPVEYIGVKRWCMTTIDGFRAKVMASDRRQAQPPKAPCAMFLGAQQTLALMRWLA